MTVNYKRHWRNRRKRSSHQLTVETEDSREYKMPNISIELHCLEFSPIKQNVGELIKQEDYALKATGSGYMHIWKGDSSIATQQRL